MRDIAVIALIRGVWLQAELRILLVPAEQVVQHGPAVGEDVPSVLENSEAQVVVKVRQRRWRETHFHVIYEQAAAADGESGNRVARACLI